MGMGASAEPAERLEGVCEASKRFPVRGSRLLWASHEVRAGSINLGVDARPTPPRGSMHILRESTHIRLAQPLVVILRRALGPGTFT
jgi:hypothetical protein